ncbi:MAG: exopolysaccharide biosynthesis protein [Oligoflexus sp.]
MSENSEISNLEDLIDRLVQVCKEHEQVSVGMVLEATGQKSFGPMLLIPGLLAFSPLSGIPGVPTLTGIMMLLITGQLLLGRSNFWLPQFLLRRSISRKKLQKALDKIRPIAVYIDRHLKPRLTKFTQGKAMYLIASLCLILSLVSPALEIVPFAISIVGAAVSIFSLSLISNDGVLAIISLLLCLGSIVIIGMSLSS